MVPCLGLGVSRLGDAPPTTDICSPLGNLVDSGGLNGAVTKDGK